MYPSVKTLYDYQDKAVNSFFEFYKNPKNTGNPLIQIPTGGGKSLIIAEIIKQIHTRNSNVKILCLTHTVEIISQDSDELKSHVPGMKYSIYSSGLGKKCLNHKVIFAGIQSIWDKHLEVGFVDLIIIDEAHLCPAQGVGRYREFIKQLALINPYLRIIGLSATPWRLDNGSLIFGEERLFDSIIYELSILELIAKGRLAPIVTPKEKLTEADLSHLKINYATGDYTTSSAEQAILDIVKPAISESIALAKDRKSWIVFCPGIKICEKVKELLNLNGIVSFEITGKTPKKKRKELQRDFKAGKFRALLTVDALTTGFNAPNVDCMICLRPTNSSSLWIQMLGRAMRIAPNKKDALLLDYGANIERHGPIDKIQPVNKAKRKKKDDEIEEIVQKPIKYCPRCENECSPTVQACPFCNYEYIIHRNIEEKASRNEVFSTIKEPLTVGVSYMVKTPHVKPGAPRSVKLMYVCDNGKSYFEWLYPEHDAMAKSKTVLYFYDLKMEIPKTVDECLTITIPKPKQIRVDETGKYPEILARYY